MLLSCSPAIAQIPVTRAAVTRVMSTQPGTSPVSSRRRAAARRVVSPRRMWALTSWSDMWISFVAVESHLELEEAEAREEGEEDGHGEHAEHDGDHHRDLLPATGLHDLSAALLPDVLGLGPEHVRERGATLDGDDDPVGEAGEGGQSGAVGEPLQRGRQAGPRTGIGEAPAQLVGQLAVGEAHDPLERPGGALAGT